MVNDNCDAAETMAMLLDARGYVPGMAHDGLAGVAAIKVGIPDLVRLDIGLPVISGIGAARKMHAGMANSLPLIAITGDCREGDREASLQAGFYGHMVKPVDIDKLAALPDRLLGNLLIHGCIT